MVHYYIQDTWEDDEDLEFIEYLEENNIEYTIISAQEFGNIEPSDEARFICDTTLYQKIKNVQHVINTYPKEFNEFYKRDIKTMTIQEVLTLPFPFFAKSSKQNKSFSLVVRNKYDMQHIKDSVESPTEEVYICAVHDIQEVFRLFIAHHELFDYALLNKETEQMHYDLPTDFIQDILSKNTYTCCIIDIGIINHKEWCIVEVNPPFSFNRYTLSIEKYIEYIEYIECENAIYVAKF